MINYEIIRKFRQKHTYIHVKSDNKVVITTSLTTSSFAIEEFVKRKTSWIKTKQKLFKKRNTLQNDTFYLFGKECKKEDFRIQNQSDIDKLYKNKIKEHISPLIKQWSQKMNLFPIHVGYRKNKTRWGSCSGKNRINFNTKLATTDPKFIEYVVVHELAHIKHKNHSKDFWNEVERYLPDYKYRQKLII